MTGKNLKCLILFVVISFVAGATNKVFAQSTAFTYQGRLQDGGTNANGSYDFQFTLWDALSGGTQQPQPSPVTVTRTNVAVANGVFTVQLDFGASAFPGADRFLEISARLAGGGGFTIMSPRQPITSTPYAIRTLSATTADALTSACVGCVQDSQINSVAGSKVSGAIPVASVPSGSANYIQNTTTQQTNSNFNISGNGTAGGTLSGNVVNAVTQYNIRGSRFASATDQENTIVGLFAGNPAGSNNSFFGYLAGNATMVGGNSFFGRGAGQNNTDGLDNSFFGFDAGFNNTTGFRNSFLGENAGRSNTSENNNTFIGNNSNGAPGITNATAIGANASVTQSNSLVLGSINGVNSAGADTNVGIGTSAPSAKLQVEGRGLDSVYAHSVSGIGLHARSEQTWAGYFEGFVLFSRGITLTELGIGGSLSPVCRNSSNQLSNCSSSLRYKTNVHSFAGGLDIVNRLRPITFTWKADGKHDVGLAAEEVENIEPLLTFRNDKGEIEGVKYNQLSAVFINAFKEQQAQIHQQQEQLSEQQRQLRQQRALIEQQTLLMNGLRRTVCHQNPRATFCHK